MPDRLISMLKNGWHVGVILAALAGTLASVREVPKKLDEHIAQQDKVLEQLQSVNQNLDKLVCIEAKIKTPAMCAFEK